MEYQKQLEQQRAEVTQMREAFQKRMDEIAEQERAKFTDEEWEARQKAEQNIDDFAQLMKDHPELKEAWDELRAAQSNVEHLQSQLRGKSVS